VRSVIDRSGLLLTRRGRAAFKHELLQDFFAAEELLRIVPCPRELAQALSKPLNADLAEFAVGALASGVHVAAALSELRCMTLLSACLLGRCGPVAQQYVEGVCTAALDRLRDRYCAISFDLGGDGKTLILDVSRAASFNQQDAPYLAAAMMIFPDARLIRAVLNAIRRIDEHIEVERLRLRACYPEKKIAWRARMFTAVYCMPFHPGPDELCTALQAARLSGFWRDAKETYHRMASLLSGYPSLTPGQLYFLIEGYAAYSREVLPPTFLYDLAKRAWSFHIYHLQLTTTHMLTLHCHNLPENERQRFVGLAEGWLDNNNPVMNSCVIDVLKVLGALNDQFTPADAAAEFEDALARPASQEANEYAFSMYCRMFDHPYDAAYAQAFYELSESNREMLLARAVQTDDTDSMFFSFLLTEVAKRPTAEVVPALQRVAKLPNANTISVQDSVNTFVEAIAALAKLSAPLPFDVDGPDVLRNGWSSMRSILYLLHTPGISPGQYARTSDQHWAYLEDEHLIDCPMRIVRHRWRDHEETSLRFLEWSKERLVRMCRDTLTRPQHPRSWFASSYHETELLGEHVQFALTILEKYGGAAICL
jgi:hypothetical protein